MRQSLVEARAPVALLRLPKPGMLLKRLRRLPGFSAAGEGMLSVVAERPTLRSEVGEETSWEEEDEVLPELPVEAGVW